METAATGRNYLLTNAGEVEAGLERGLPVPEALIKGAMANAPLSSEEMK